MRMSPVGANADEPHLSAGWSGDVRLREREDGVKGAVAGVERFCPSGQARLGRAWRLVGLKVAMEASGACAAGARRRDDFELFGGRGDAAGDWLAQVSAAAGAWGETEIADTAERTGARERRLCGEVGDFCGAFLIIKRG